MDRQIVRGELEARGGLVRGLGVLHRRPRREIAEAHASDPDRTVAIDQRDRTRDLLALEHGSEPSP